MKTISKRCGKNTCQHYNKHNALSGCKIFEDRNECEVSLKHRDKVAKKSRKNQKPQTNWY